MKGVSESYWWAFVYVVILSLGLMVVGFLSFFGLYAGPIVFLGATGLVFAVIFLLGLSKEQNDEQCAQA